MGAKQFECFTIELQKDADPGLLDNQFPKGWTRETIPGHADTYDIVPRGDEFNLSVSDAWDKAYDLMKYSFVRNAEPCFEIELLNEQELALIATAEPRFRESILHGSDEPDPQTENRWDWHLEQMRVFDAWNEFHNKYSGEEDPLTARLAKIMVAHPDTGYTKHAEIYSDAHPLLGWSILENKEDALDPRDYQGYPGHGTGTASVIMSPRGPEGKEHISGVAPGVNFYPIRTTKSVILMGTRKLALAIEKAIEIDADVISISLGSPLFSLRLRKAVTSAVESGIIICCAAGNTYPWVVRPAVYEEVVAIAGTNYNRKHWKGSSRGEEVDVSAPANSVYRAGYNDKDKEEVSRSSGTSFSTAATAGVAALWLAYHGKDKLDKKIYRSKLPLMFRQLLQRSASTDCDLPAGKFGAGIVDAYALLQEEIPKLEKAGGFKSVRPLPSTGQANNKEPEMDSGGLETVRHFVSEVDGISDSELTHAIARVLDIPERSVKEKLSVFGREFCFRLATEADLQLAMRSAVKGVYLDDLVRKYAPKGVPQVKREFSKTMENELSSARGKTMENELSHAREESLQKELSQARDNNQYKFVMRTVKSAPKILENVIHNKRAGIHFTIIYWLATQLILFTIAISAKDSKVDVNINVTTILVGIGIGWMVGVLLSPDPVGTAGKRLRRGAAAISAVLSGYIIAKGEDTIIYLLGKDVLLKPVVGFRVLSFIASFCASVILVFVWREYRQPTRK